MEYEWRITDESGGDPSELIAKMILENDAFKPYRIKVDSDHAGYVEFGTLPSTAPPRPKEEQGTPTAVELKFREWVKRKFNISDPKKLNRVAHNIYKDIMQNGMPPIPYMRPAMYTALDEIEARNLNDPWLDHNTTKDLADWIVELMKEYLDNNDTVDSGELRDSIQPPEEVDLESDTEDYDTESVARSDTIWDSRTEGINPDRPPRARYQGALR